MTDPFIPLNMSVAESAVLSAVSLNQPTSSSSSSPASPQRRLIHIDEHSMQDDSSSDDQYQQVDVSRVLQPPRNRHGRDLLPSVNNRGGGVKRSRRPASTTRKAQKQTDDSVASSSSAVASDDSAAVDDHVANEEMVSDEVVGDCVANPARPPVKSSDERLARGKQLSKQSKRLGTVYTKAGELEKLCGVSFLIVSSTPAGHPRVYLSDFAERYIDKATLISLQTQLARAAKDHGAPPAINGDSD